MKGKNQHVVPVGSRWGVRPANGDLTSTHRTQGVAIGRAIPVARRERSEVVIHRRNGQIRDSDSYGNDPASIRDRKH
ncbi:MAG TPA: DUF2188 domain-containing protein [Pyrinomonadaceae bacterium]